MTRSAPSPSAVSLPFGEGDWTPWPNGGAIATSLTNEPLRARGDPEGERLGPVDVRKAVLARERADFQELT